MSILAEILSQKQVEIASLDAAALRRAAELAPPPRDFLGAVSSLPGSPSAGVLERGPVRLIAELKRASPSRGVLAPHLDLFQVADIYAQNGASAISVLTDQKYFQGSLATLSELRFNRSSELPLLRKDFLISEAQLYESRAAGADAVLLIAAALTDDSRLSDLHAFALELGLMPLVEVHNEAETERALRVNGIRLIGINNRDLVTFEVSLETTERVRPLIPAEIAVVAESGIFSARDSARLGRAGVDAILVGEALVTAGDIGAKVRELSALSALRSAAEDASSGHQ